MADAEKLGPENRPKAGTMNAAPTREASSAAALSSSAASPKTVAEKLAASIAAINPTRLPAAMRTKCRDLAVDVVGLCLTARREDYVAATLAACDDDGPCTAIGHARRLGAAGAALVNGTAAHGEDFDDTFEGGPVHAGAVIVPAVLAACERHRPDGGAALAGIVAGVETMCRLGLVTPKRVHKAGFHPTAVFGAVAAAAGVAAALGLPPAGIVNALGIAGSMASGIIEYLAEGAWTKRMHAGWAAQSGLRAALMAQHGFRGPRTVFEGTHGLFHGFAHTREGDYEALLGDFGSQWQAETLAFKPYPCGTMTHPYIDCARRLKARGINPPEIVELICEVGEGTVHRLWEPLADKQRPANGYGAKFSTPYCIAAGFVRGNVGLSDFTDDAVADEAVLAVARKVRYVVDPDNPYPKNFTGHVRAVMRNGTAIEERQPHMRGGAHEPLTSADIEDKFVLNARHGGWPEKRIAAALAGAKALYDGPLDLAALRP
jgi:2-methylcitrate dehydratase PrpD